MAARRYILVRPHTVAAATLLDALGAPLRPLLGRGRAPAPPRVVGCLVLDHIGDVLLATPALALVRRRYPSARLVVFCGPWGRDMLATHPDVDQLVTFAPPWFDRDHDGTPKRGGRLAAIRELAALLRTHGVEVALDFRGDVRHMVAMSLARVPYRAGFGITGGGFLLSHVAPFPFESHTVVRLMSLPLSLPDAAGSPAPEPPATFSPGRPPLVYRVSEEDAAWARRWLGERGLAEPRAIVHPGAGHPFKTWPIEKWQAAVRHLRARMGSLVVTGSPAEAELAARLADDPGPGPAPIAVAAGEASLGRTAALMQAAALYVGGSTGALHLATAVGTPVVAIQDWTSDPHAWGPWSERAEVVAAPHPGGIARPTAPHAATEGIEVAQVIAAIDRLNAKRG